MLKINDLSVSYGSIKAVRNVSFFVGGEEIVTLIGANGAGKTSLLNAISGIIPPSGGSIEYREQDITHLPVRQRVKNGLVLCPEGRQVFPRMTVEENLLLGAHTITEKQTIQELLDSAYEMFPVLRSRHNQLGGTLSGGEQQMLAICRSLMSKPKLLMLDEPSLGLAPVIVEQVFELLDTIHATGVPLLLVEQNAVAALELCDRAYVMENGEIALSGTGRELLENKKIRESYLGV